MIEVTPRATKLLTNHFARRERMPIRIFMKIGGCGMRTLGVAMEAAGEADRVFDVDGFRYVVNRRLLKRIQPIRVDSDGVAFFLSANGVSPASGCGSCGYMCGFRGGLRCGCDCADCPHPCGDPLWKPKRANENGRRRFPRSVAAP